MKKHWQQWCSLISSCHWKTLVPFCLWKKRSENAISELLQNHTEKQIMPSKTAINWPFDGICYLLIASFNWKIGVFQQTVVRVCYILNRNTNYLWNIFISLQYFFHHLEEGCKRLIKSLPNKSKITIGR